MRTFIALDLTPEMRQGLSGLQAELKKSNADVKWVDPKNIHLTLKFLGDITEQQVEPVTQALDKIAAHRQPYELSLSGIGAFPKLDYPRVVWVGIESGKEETKEWAAKIDEELSRLGFKKEGREFKAHLTIGRVRSPKNKDRLKSIIQSTTFAPSSKIPIDSITFYQSTLTPQGPIYTSLHTAHF